MKLKPAKTLDDLHPPIPGKSQMIPLNLWGDYQQKYCLQVVEQRWESRRHCPVVIARPIAPPVSSGVASPASLGIESPVSLGIESPVSLGIESPVSLGIESPVSLGKESTK